jgi:hypothetical protein
MIAEPVAGRPRDFRDVRNSPATGSDTYIPLRYVQLQPVKLFAYRGADIGDWIRDQFLMYAK